MRKVYWGLVLLAFAGVAQGGGPKAVRKQLEASMQVTGTAEIDAAGALTGYTLDAAGVVPEGIARLLDERLPRFRFAPVVRDGQAQPVTAKMTLLLVAHRTDPEHYDLRMESARFVDAARPPSDEVSVASARFPVYPTEALNANVTGTAYVAVRIGRDGHAMDAEVKQVNLTVIGDDIQMRHWRDVLARSALAAIRQWTFYPPTTGPHASDTEFVGVVPVEYLLDDRKPVRAGHWAQYVRGPIQDIPWLRNEDDAGNGDEAVAAGTVGQRGAALRLLTPLEAG